jgi:hypothetical protein
MIYLNIIKYNVTSIISIDNKIRFTEKNTLKFKYITNYTTYVILLYSCEAWLRINVTLLEAFSAVAEIMGVGGRLPPPPCKKSEILAVSQIISRTGQSAQSVKVGNLLKVCPPPQSEN